MSEGLLGEVTAAYVLKNRKNGWLEYALQVLAAGPYLRHALIEELCTDVRQALEQRLPGHKVATDMGEANTWFSVDVTRDVWGELGVSLGNWKHDASSIGVGVYNYGDGISHEASAQIRDCLATKQSPWNRKKHPRWVWNHPDFLARIVDDREGIVSEVAKELLEVVTLTDDVLQGVAKGRVV